MQRGVQDKFRFSTFCFQYVTYLAQFVLSVILEPKGKKAYDILTEVMSIILHLVYVNSAWIRV